MANMGGFTFCCGDFGPAMEAKGTVTNEILEMIDDDPRVCYVVSDGTARGGRTQTKALSCPDRIIDVGIQEMNMVTVAAGLAHRGYIPFLHCSASQGATMVILGSAFITPNSIIVL